MKDKPLDELSERLVIKVNNSSLSLKRYQLKGPSQTHLFLIDMGEFGYYILLGACRNEEISL